MFEGVTLGERYQVFGRIGASTLVMRFDGVDVLLARPVDIVTLTPRALADADLRDRFAALGRAAATRSHPHIVEIFDAGTDHGRPYIVTEHLTGEPLRVIIAEEAPFHPEDAVALIQQLAGPADQMAIRGASGEMVSADSVIVDAAGKAIHSDLLTFGQRFAAAEDEWAGRPHAPLPPATPVPALATIAYELLTATRPDNGPRSAQPSTINGAVTPEIDRIILRALDPGQGSYRGAAAFANALTAAVDRAAPVRETAPPPAPAPPPIQTPPRQVREEPRIVTSPPAAAPPDPGATLPDTASDWVEEPRLAPARSRTKRSSPWSWVAIGVLGALVLALGLPRLWDTIHTGEPAPTVPAVANETNNVPIVIDDPTQPAVTKVPAVTGLTRDVAAKTLADAGLVLQEGTPAHSDTVPAGSVVSQQPAAGKAIPGDRTVTVTLSQGPETVDLAALDLPGKSADAAMQTLGDKGFVVRTREEGSQSVPAGTVISLEPDGAEAPGTTVTLILSVGDKLEIPRAIFSMPVKTAEQQLAQAGITVASTIAVGPAAIQGKLDTNQYQIVSGDVIGVQNTAGDASFGAWIARGSEVTLVYYDAAG